MPPAAVHEIAKLREQVFETITTITREHVTDPESARLVDRLQLIAYEIGTLEYSG